MQLDLSFVHSTDIGQSIVAGAPNDLYITQLGGTVMSSTTATVQLVAHAELDVTWDVATLTNPTWFYSSFGPLPGVVDVWGQVGDWNAVGKTRTLKLSDGGSVIEQLTDVARADFFAYNLSEFQGLFGRIVSGARAEWHFWEEGDSTAIRWSYTYTAKPGFGLVVGAIVRLLWSRYMQRTLPVIVREAERQGTRV